MCQAGVGNVQGSPTNRDQESYCRHALHSGHYEAVFDKADQVFDSNQGTEPVTHKSVAAVSSNSSEVAALQKNKQQKNKGQYKGNNNGQSNNTGGQKAQTPASSSSKPSKPKVNEDNLCRIHAKWKDNATFCAAPWACRMKNVWKAPQ